MSSKKPYGIIYLLTSPSGKQYVGQTVQPLKARLKGHKSTAKRLPNLLIAKAINKYGLDTFKAEILEEAFTSEELDTLEEKWINNFNTMSPNGYNTKDVKEGQFSEKVRKRISASKMGHDVPEEVRNKIKNSLNKYYEDNNIGIIHGTTTGYSWYKCRCVDCKKAHKDYLKTYSENTLISLREKDHGTFKAYRAGCRCDTCKAFKSQKAKEYWNRRKDGRKNEEISERS